MKKSLSSIFKIERIRSSYNSTITNENKDNRGQLTANRYIIICTIISLLLFSKAEIDLRTIAICNEIEIKSPNLESSILNPVFGFLSLASGTLHCLRFFHHNLQIQYGYKFSREFIKDKCPNDNINMLLKTILFLFPSSAGILNVASIAFSNPHNKYFSHEKDRSNNISQLAHLFLTVLKKEDPRKNKNYKLKTLYYKFSRAILNINIDSKRKNESKPNTNSLEGDDDSRIIKLLAIHAYALKVINSSDEYNIYLKTLLNHCPLEIEYSLKMETKDFRLIYEMKDDFPYSSINPPGSNGSVPFYNRKAKRFDKDHLFADCVEISILHLCNCLFFDYNAQKCNLDHLNLDENSELLKFYKDYDFKPFTLTSKMREDWCTVIQDLDNHGFKIEGNNYNPQLIHYLKNNQMDVNKDKIKNLAKNGNGLKSGIINMMSALVKICSSEIQVSNNHNNENILIQPDNLVEFYKKLAGDIKPFNIEDIFEELLNKICHPEIELEIIKIDERDYFKTDVRLEFIGKVELNFKYKKKRSKIENIIELCVTEIHTELSFLSKKEEKNNNFFDSIITYFQTKNYGNVLFYIAKLALGLFTGVDRFHSIIAYFQTTNDKNMLFYITRRFISLFTGVKFKDSDYLFEILYNPGLLNTNEQKLKYLFNIYEYSLKLDEKIKEIVKKITISVLKSTALVDFHVKKTFLFFILYYKMNLIDLQLEENEIAISWIDISGKENYSKEALIFLDNYIIDKKINVSALKLNLEKFTNNRIIEMIKVTKSTLVNLDLERLSFDDHSYFSSFFNCLSKVKNLKTIYFSKIEIKYKPENAESLKKEFLTLLKNCKKLNDFYIHISPNSSDLSIAVIEALAETEVSEQKLELLTISSEDYCPDQGKKIIQILKNNPYLIEVVIENVFIGLDFAHSLIKLLENEPCLEYLKLINTNIGHECVLSIITAFIQHKCLNEISISKNEINYEISEFISEINENPNFSQFIFAELSFGDLFLRKK